MTASYKSLLLAGLAAAGWMMYSAPASACPIQPDDPPERAQSLLATISGCPKPKPPTKPTPPPPRDPCGPPTMIQIAADTLGIPTDRAQLCLPPAKRSDQRL